MKAPLLLILFVNLLWALSAAAAEPSQRPGAITNDAAAAKQIEARLQWNRRTLVEAYDKTGTRDPKWDGNVRAGLEAFARMRSNPQSEMEQNVKMVTTNMQKAVDAGCTDPMVTYLHVRFPVKVEVSSAAEQFVVFRAVATKLQASAYHPLRKAYAAIWTADAVNQMAAALPWNQPDMKITLDGRVYRGSVRSNVIEAAQDSTMPADELFELCNLGFDKVLRTPAAFEYYVALESLLLKKYGNDYRLHYLKARGYKDHAWRARGVETADKVSDEQFKLFHERLNIAAEALRQAWKLNSQDAKVPTFMTTVLLGLDEDREEMEKWFQRAMALDPANYAACKNKMYYLEPKWNGSAEEMLAFGRECAKSRKWKGEVPLVLQGAHETLAQYVPQNERENYWARPEVWKDVRESFESFFAHPDADPGWRHNYARLAYWCQHWDVFGQQLTKFRGTNHAFFGGKETFDSMVQYAREQLSKDGKDAK